jgi:polyisoprenoid-binding protein YceI
VAEASASARASVQAGLLPDPTATGVTVGLGGRYTAKPGSKVRIEGTSNVHDWQVEGNIIGGRAEFGTGFPSDRSQVQAGPVQAEVQVRIPVRSLKSVNPDGTPFNAKMDDIMCGLLREPTFKNIQFTLQELTLAEVPQAEGKPLVFASRGELMVAGVTNSITMPVEMTRLPGDKLKFSGACSVWMTDFGIQPPRPLNLGITTADDVKLSFEWTVGRKPPERVSP